MRRTALRFLYAGKQIGKTDGKLRRKNPPARQKKLGCFTIGSVSPRLILRSAKRVSKEAGGPYAASWFETRCFAALLTMRV